MSRPAIVLDRVVKRSGRTAALDGVSATIAAGQLVGLVGPGGSGKTALLRLIAGLLRPDGGRIVVLGHDSVRDAAAIQAQIGYVPQSSGSYERLTVRENLDLHAGLRNLAAAARPARFAAVLRQTGLEEFVTSRAGALPAGARQRLGLACALLARPRLVLLDEPGAALDPPSRRALLQIARSLAADGATVIWSTARFDEAERCAHVLMLDQGRIVAQGSPGSIAAHLAGRVRAVAAVGSERRRLARMLSAMPGVQEVQTEIASVRVIADAPGRDVALHDVASRDGPAAVPVVPRLEESFLALTAPCGPAAALAAPVPAAPGPAIEARGLAKRFGGRLAVEGVDITVARGEIFGLIGASGAGKTTILRMLCGLMAPTAGEARVGGVDLRLASPAARTRVGYMSQGDSLYEEISVAENLRFLADAYGLDRRQGAERIARLGGDHDLGSWIDLPFGLLPPAARQRVALAATFLHAPEIMLLDDPASGVDPRTRCDLWRIIEAAADRGVAVLVASAATSDGAKCDRVLLIDRGRPVAAGSPDALLARAQQDDPAAADLEDAFAALLDERARCAAS